MDDGAVNLPVPELSPSARAALVIATARYEDPAFSKLRSPVRDAEDLAAVLGDPAVGGFTVTTVVDQPDSQVRLAIAGFLADRSPDDTVLIYLSCHGIQDQGGRLYFATSNSMKARPRASAVKSADILEELDECRAGQQILILDCCFSGAFGDGHKGEVDLEGQFARPGRGRVVLTASRGYEYSFEGRPIDGAVLPGSVFTTGLVNGLRTGDADADADGYVAWDEAFAYADRHVRETGVRQNPQQWLSGGEGGKIILARNPSGRTVVPAHLPEDLVGDLASRSEHVRVGAVNEVARWLSEPNPARVLAAERTLRDVAEHDNPRVAAVAQAALGQASPRATESRSGKIPANGTPGGSRHPAGQPRVAPASSEEPVTSTLKKRVHSRARRPRLALLVSALATLGFIAGVALLLVNLFAPNAHGKPQAGGATGTGRPTVPATVATAPGLVTVGCTLSSNSTAPAQGKEWTAGPNDEECVGYSSTDALVFSNLYPFGSPGQQAQDERVTFDEEQIFAEDKTADRLASRDDRAEVGLVYFAGLTEGAAEDFDSAQAEELEGLLAAQMLTNVPGGTAPVLKIVVANGGSKMQQATYVAKLLLPLFAGNSSMLGVVGLDRSTGDVLDAIDQFTQHKIPVLATTLSADNFAKIGEYYFSLAPPNSDEAKLILNYIVNTVTRYFVQPASSYFSAGQVIPTRVTVYEPPDTNAANPGNPDYYLITLVNDLKSDAPKILSPETKFQKTESHSQSALCGAATVDIYAGRHDRPANAKPGDLDDFGNFMKVVNGCTDKPFVIGDDGVSRFIADPADRDEGLGGDWPISYVTKGLTILSAGGDCLSEGTVHLAQPGLRRFCGAYAQIATELKNSVADVQLPWTGERVGLAYDAAEMFLQAENVAGQALTRTAIPGEFQSMTYQGVTGTVSFSATDHTGVDSPGSMPLAIVRIPLSDSDALPVCAVTSASATAGGVPSDTLPNPKNCVHGQF
jgi:uncharacterized caspase-like protein